MQCLQCVVYVYVVGYKDLKGSSRNPLVGMGTARMSEEQVCGVLVI